MTFPSPLDKAADSDKNTDSRALNAQPSEAQGAAHNMMAEVQAVNGLTAGHAAMHKRDAEAQAQAKANEPVQYNHSGFVGAFVENAAYHGVQQTTKSLAQIVDMAASTKTADRVNLVAKPLAAEYKSSEWYGEQFGGAVGKIAPFIAAFAVTRGASARLRLEASLTGAGEEAALLSRRNMILTGQSAVAGFSSEAVFTPNEKTPHNFSEFAGERAKNGTIGALDMAAITAGSLSLKNLAAASAKDAPLASALLRNSGVAGAITGMPTGMLSAEAHARLFEGRGSTAEEREQSALSMAVVGFGLGAVHGKATEGAESGRNRAPSISEAFKSSLDRTMQKVDDFVAQGNPFMAQQNRLAFAYADAGASRAPLRSQAMESTLRDLNSTVMFRDGEAEGGRNNGGSGRVRARRQSADRQGSRQSEFEDRIEAADKIELKGDGQPRVPLVKSLNDLGLSEVADFVSRDRILKNQKVVRSLGSGNDSPAVLELASSNEFPAGGALKVTIPEGGWQNEWGKRPFDAQLLSKVHEVDMDSHGHTGAANVYVQELVDTAPRYAQDQVDSFFSLMQESKLEFGDPGTDPMKQVGISRKTGELVLIDYPSVDKAGAHQTLREIIDGHQGVEAEYERENKAIRDGAHEEDKPDFETVIDAEKQAQSQEALHDGQFTPREQELLTQIQQGIPQKEVLEFYAILEGKFNAKGMPDTKALKNSFDGLIKRAQKAGVLEKKAKGSKMEADDNDGYW